MIVSKIIAKQVAVKLVSGKQDKLEELRTKFSLDVEGFYMSRIPKEIIAQFKENGIYIRTLNYVQIVGNGFNFKRIFLINDLPQKKNNYTFEPTKQEAEKLMKISNLIDNLYDEIQQVYLEVETAILSLKTYKMVEANFPEAFALLPNKSSVTALVVNLDSIREKIK